MPDLACTRNKPSLLPDRKWVTAHSLTFCSLTAKSCVSTHTERGNSVPRDTAGVWQQIGRRLLMIIKVVLATKALKVPDPVLALHPHEPTDVCWDCRR